jgi:hypothetical protein
MAGFDGTAFGAEVVSIVKDYVARELGVVSARLEAIEKRIDTLPAPIDLSSDLAALKSAVEAIEIPAFPEVPQLPDIDAIVLAAVEKAAPAIPVPRDGQDGTSVSIDDVMPALEKRVDEFLSAIPAPKDGTSVTVDDVAQLISSEVEKRVSQLPLPKDGKDGLDVKEMFRAEGGKLVAVMSDGTTRDLGVFVGKDGQDADMAAIEKSIAEKVDAIPRPKDGKDGFSLKHFDAELMDDGRTVVLKFQDGSDTGYSVELGIPAMIYRGVFKEGQAYEKGDTVTWGGSLWHCDEAVTTSKPDGAEKHWTLAAKKGRDGRDGEVKATREPAKVKI